MTPPTTGNHRFTEDASATFRGSLDVIESSLSLGFHSYRCRRSYVKIDPCAMWARSWRLTLRA
jgi:hypothetical protein